MLPASPERDGGAYTFERDLLEGLLGLVPSSPHDFVLLGDAAAVPASMEVACSVVPLPAADVPRSKARRALSALSARFARARHGVTSRARHLDALGIQALVYLGPWSLEAEGIPYLTFVWDLEHRVQPYFPELAGGGEWQRREAHFRSMLPRAAAVVTGTRDGKQQIERFYGVAPERILILPHPTPSDALRYARERPSSAARASLDLLYPAQLWPHKNHVGLLHALHALRERHGIRARLLLPGADLVGHRAYLETWSRRLGLQDQVEFLGFVPRERLLQLLAEATMLVYPTTFGPENLPPLEAFALGCPVVTTRVAGADEQLGDAALMVDLHDDDALADAMHRVLTDAPLREALVARGRTRARRWTGRDVAAGIMRWVDDFARVRRLWP